MAAIDRNVAVELLGSHRNMPPDDRPDTRKERSLRRGVNHNRGTPFGFENAPKFGKPLCRIVEER